MTLLSVARDIEPLMQQVAVVCLVYMRGVHQGRQYKLPSQKATLLLTTLYNTLVSCDTLYEAPAVDGFDIDLGQNIDTPQLVMALKDHRYIVIFFHL